MNHNETRTANHTLQQVTDAFGVYWETGDGLYRAEPQTLLNGDRRLVIKHKGVKWRECWSYGQAHIADCQEIIDRLRDHKENPRPSSLGTLLDLKKTT